MQNLAGIKEIKAISVLIPPILEQWQIVNKLEELISDLNNGIANLKAAKYKLEIYRQAVLKKAFEGELTKEWREQYTSTNHDDTTNGKDATNHIDATTVRLYTAINRYQPPTN